MHVMVLLKDLRIIFKTELPDAFGWSKKESSFFVHYLASIIIHSHDNICRKWALFASYHSTTCNHLALFGLQNLAFCPR